MGHNCQHCGEQVRQPRSAINRAIRSGLNLYCGRECASAARRVAREVKIEAKRKYDAIYRSRNRATLKAKKAAYYKRTKDPEHERRKRKARAHLHAEYCRRPEYRKWKREYDRNRLASIQYGSFAEAALLLRDIESEIKQQASRHEIYTQNGTLNKAQERRRAL